MIPSPIFRHLFLAVAVFALLPSHLQAQSAAPATWTGGSGSSAVDFEFRLDGSIIEEGYGSSTLTNADLQSASHFIWDPTLSALRAGGVSSETTSEVGQYSVALGSGVNASGEYSMAIGEYSVASGSNSFAISGGSSTGIDSISGAEGGAAGDYSISLDQSYVSGQHSFGMGLMAFVTGNSSVAIGDDAYVTGSYSFALGDTTFTSADHSMVTGFYTGNSSYDSFVMGFNNIGLSETGAYPNPTSWVSSDPLFEIGNGNSGAPSDAFVVYKDGTAKFGGAVTVPQSGDIPMYTGN